MNSYRLIYTETQTQEIESYLMSIKNYFKEIYKADDADEILELYEDKKPHLIILDVEMLPIDGLTLAQQIRKKDKDVKIILFSFYADKNRLLKAISLNLINYMVKPLERTPLLENIEKAFDELKEDKEKDKIMLDSEIKLLFNTKSQLLYLDSKHIPLTKYEGRLLSLFIRKRNSIVSQENIFLEVWDEYDVEFKSDNIRNLVKNLRKKLPSNLIKSSYGNGYIFKQ